MLRTGPATHSPSGAILPQPVPGDPPGAFLLASGVATSDGLYLPCDLGTLTRTVKVEELPLESVAVHVSV